MNDLFQSFAFGKHNTRKNPQKAKKWLLKSANAKDSNGLYHLGEMYYWGGGKKQTIPNDLPFGDGDFPQSYSKAFEFYSASADQGCPGAYQRLSEMFRRGTFVTANAETALKYASLSVYQQEKKLCGRDCWEMFALYYEPKLDIEDRLFDLSTYWLGRALDGRDSNPEYGKILAGHIAQYTAENYWHKHTVNTIFPGYTTLPLAKKLEIKYGVDESESSPLITAMKGRCGLPECKKENDGSMKSCSGCKVFHYCGIEVRT